MLKFKLDPTDTKVVNGVTVTRIVALRDFGNVNTEDKGGYLEKEDNLSQDNGCWIYSKAKVSGNARVSGDTEISEKRFQLHFLKKNPSQNICKKILIH